MAAILEILEREGIFVRLNAKCLSVAKSGAGIAATLDCASGAPVVSGTDLLIATGRRPNTDDLGLDEAGIAHDGGGSLPSTINCAPMCRVYGRSAIATAKAPSRIRPIMISRSSRQTSSTTIRAGSRRHVPSTAEWIARHITDAFPWTETPRYLIRDRDAVCGQVVTRRLKSMGIRDRPTAPRSPWQNGYVERLIGSIRRECLDHVVVFGEAHLCRIVKAYVS